MLANAARRYRSLLALLSDVELEACEILSRTEQDPVEEAEAEAVVDALVASEVDVGQARHRNKVNEDRLQFVIRHIQLVQLLEVDEDLRRQGLHEIVRDVEDQQVSHVLEETLRQSFN